LLGVCFGFDDVVYCLGVGEDLFDLVDVGGFVDWYGDCGD